jgi:hypothetical protein
MSELSYGQRAVGLNFNPSKDDSVAEAKQRFAAIIDLLNDLRDAQPYGKEQARLCSIAITEAQAAQMWAVKAITWRE